MMRRTIWNIGLVVSASIALLSAPTFAQDRCCFFRVRHNFRVCLPQGCQIPQVEWSYSTQAAAWEFGLPPVINTNSGTNIYPIPSTDTQCVSAVTNQQCGVASACARFQVNWIPGTNCVQGSHEAFGRACTRCRLSGANAAASSHITIRCGLPNAAGQIVWQPAFQDVVGGECGVRNNDPVVLTLRDATGQQRQDTLFDLRAQGFNWEYTDQDGDGWGDSARILYDGRSGAVELHITVGGASLTSPSGELHVEANNGVVVRAVKTGIFESVRLPGPGAQLPDQIPIPAQFELSFQVPQGWSLESIGMGGDGSAGQPVPRTPGDVNGDGCVDDADLLAVLFAFGQTGSGLPEDVNGDGVVDDADLLTVLFNFGQGC